MKAQREEKCGKHFGHRVPRLAIMKISNWMAKYFMYLFFYASIELNKIEINDL